MQHGVHVHHWVDNLIFNMTLTKLLSLSPSAHISLSLSSFLKGLFSLHFSFTLFSTEEEEATLCFPNLPSSSSSSSSFHCLVSQQRHFGLPRFNNARKFSRKSSKHKLSSFQYIFPSYLRLSKTSLWTAANHQRCYKGSCDLMPPLSAPPPLSLSRAPPPLRGRMEARERRRRRRRRVTFALLFQFYVEGVTEKGERWREEREKINKTELSSSKFPILHLKPAGV